MEIIELHAGFAQGLEKRSKVWKILRGDGPRVTELNQLLSNSRIWGRKHRRGRLAP